MNKDKPRITYKWFADGLEITGNLPPRITKIEAAELMGIQPSDLCGLHKHRLLYPCGHKPKKGRKPYNNCYYSTSEVVEKLVDVDWWHDAQHAISQYNKDRKKGKVRMG